MPDVELPSAEIDDVDGSDPYKRRVALLVVFITLFGTIVAYLQTTASNEEDLAARTSQLNAIGGLGERVESDARFQSAYDVYTQSKILERQRISARRQGREDEVRSLAEAQASLTQLSPLVADPGEEADPAEAEYTDVADPGFPNRFGADVGVGADEARLRQSAAAESENAWGSRADSYVAVITVLAVALFLIGLSLTVSGRGRLLLVVPGAGIAAWCVLWAAVISLSEIPETPRQAIESVAEGNRLVARGQFDEAVESYSKAIEARSDYGEAFAERSSARFLAGTPQDINSTLSVSVTSDEALKASIEDGERALELGGDDDINVLGNLAFNYFLDGRFDEAADLTQRALELNDQLAQVWLNLGVMELARGNEDESREAYENGLELMLDVPSEQRDFFVDASLLAGARTDLEIAATLVDDRDELIEETLNRLAQAETSLQDLDPVDGRPPRGVEVSGFELSADGARVRAEFDYEGVDPEGVGIGFVWYHREDDDVPFVQRQEMTLLTTLFDAVDEDGNEDGLGRAFVARGIGPCPVPGEYRLDVYLDGQRVASEETSVEAGVLGSPVIERDPLLGIEVCRPEDWSRERLTEEFLTFISPDGSASFATGSFLVQSEDLAAGKTFVEDQSITATGAPEPVQDLQDFDFGNVTGRLGFFDNPNGSTTAVAAFLGSDNVLRSVIAISNTGDFTEIDEMLATLTFTDVAPDDPGIVFFEDFGTL